MKRYISLLSVITLCSLAISCRSTKKTTRIEDEKSDPSAHDTDSNDLKKVTNPSPEKPTDPVDPQHEIKTTSWSLNKDDYTALLTKKEDLTSKTTTYLVMVTKSDDNQFDNPIEVTGDPLQGLEASFFETDQSPNASYLTVKILANSTCSVRWESNGEGDIFTLVFSGSCPSN